MIKGGMTYPLLDAEHYDDELGEGFSYAAVADETTGDGMYVADCWIINKEDKVHPGYDACPVPIHVNDLDVANGFQTTMPDRERKWGGWG